MQLILTRHAKSSWDDPYLSDHDRPLSKRGRKSSDAIGKWLAQNMYLPKIVISSTSKRTTETWQRMEKFLPSPDQVHYEPDLYHGYPEDFVESLMMAEDSPVLMLGHNPGIGLFAHSVLQETPSHFAFVQYPTAATLVCELPVNSWREFRPGIAEFVDFVVPRELV